MFSLWVLEMAGVQTALRLLESVTQRLLDLYHQHPQYSLLWAGALAMYTVAVVLMTTGLGLWQRRSARLSWADDEYSQVDDDGFSDTSSMLVG